MGKVHSIGNITWKNYESASFKAYAGIGAILSLGLITATVRNYEILQMTVPYSWYLYFTAFWLLYPSLGSLSANTPGECSFRGDFTA